MWLAAQKLPRSPGHPFYERLNQVLEKAGFDAFVEGLCERFYAAGIGRPSLRPGRYFRMLLVGYFEGLNSERAIAWRIADSMSVRAFLDYGPEEASPNHSTLSRTRRRIDVETHGEVFRWVLAQLGEAGLVRGKTIGIDATTLEANAALRSLVRRDTGEDYESFLKGLAEASGVPTPTRKELVRFDRKRKKKTSNREGVNPHDPEAKITKLKDGRTRLGHKVEEAVDLETGAVVAVTAPEELGDTQTMGDTLRMAREEVKAVGSGAQVREVVTDQGYHSNETVLELKELGLRGYLSETDRGRRNWKGKKPEVPSAGVCESAADPGEAGTTVAATEERVGGATVRASVRHGRVASDLRAGPRRRAQATADPRVWFQPGIADAPPDGRGHAPESSGPRPGASFYAAWSANGPLDRLESARGALLGVDPVRWEVLGFSDPSINHLHVSLQKEQ